MNDRKARLGFFASHGGSNFEAIAKACHAGQVHADPTVLIYNNPNAKVKERAASLNVAAFCMNASKFESLDDLDSRIIQVLSEHEVDLVILAGYMKKIGPKVLFTYSGRILNIHPALLPKYGGKGMYGMKVHEQVVHDREQESGATIHVVTKDYDEGPILAQGKVAVVDSDSAESLAKKVLLVEHQLYPSTIQAVISGEVRLPEPGDQLLRERLSRS